MSSLARSSLSVAVLLAASGCVPTISQHSFRDVGVTITDTSSDQPIPRLPFRVFYTYSPADSRLVYHVELRTPHEVRAETDSKGHAVIKLADYAWNICLEVDDSEKRDWDRFWLSKGLVRKGGTVETRYAGQKHRKLRLQLRPLREPNPTMQRMGACRLAQWEYGSPPTACSHR